MSDKAMENPRAPHNQPFQLKGDQIRRSKKMKVQSKNGHNRPKGHKQ